MEDEFLRIFVGKLHDETVDLELDFVGLTQPTISDMRRIIKRVETVTNAKRAMYELLSDNYRTENDWPQIALDVLDFIDRVFTMVKVDDTKTLKNELLHDHTVKGACPIWSCDWSRRD